MPHLREATEVRFYVPDEVPADAVVLSDIDAARWRKYHANKGRAGVGYRPGWLAQYGPTDLRTVAARVYTLYCECKECRNWRDRGRPGTE
jgi:hypothetical protein